MLGEPLTQHPMVLQRRCLVFITCLLQRETTRFRPPTGAQAVVGLAQGAPTTPPLCVSARLTPWATVASTAPPCAVSRLPHDRVVRSLPALQPAGLSHPAGRARCHCPYETPQEKQLWHHGLRIHRDTKRRSLANRTSEVLLHLGTILL